MLPAAQELAARLAAGPPPPTRAIKESLAYAADRRPRPALAKEAELQAAMGADRATTATPTAAFVAKQKPDLQRPLS